MRRLTLLVCLLCLATPALADAADRYPLHVGSTGPRVAGLKWMMGGHRPSAYRGIRCATASPKYYYGRITGQCVKRAKYRMGFPLKVVNRVAGRDFVEMLKGDRARPRGYVARARARARAVVDMPPWAPTLIRIARGELGVAETSWNYSWRIAQYQSTTGAYHAPWCVSFQQWVRVVSGYGSIANRSAGVFYVVSWSSNRGLLRAKPRPGYLVAFMDRLGHIGLVEKVTRYGFWSIEGNASNRVLERYHSYGLRPVRYIEAKPHVG